MKRLRSARIVTCGNSFGAARPHRPTGFAISSDQLGGDGIDEGATAADESEGVVIDVGEAFGGECDGA